jgi:hypothetical protein
MSEDIGSMCFTVAREQVIAIGENIEVVFTGIYSTGIGGGVQRIRLVIRAPKSIKVSRDKTFKLLEAKNEQYN